MWYKTNSSIFFFQSDVESVFHFVSFICLLYQLGAENISNSFIFVNFKCDVVRKIFAKFVFRIFMDCSDFSKFKKKSKEKKPMKINWKIL